MESQNNTVGDSGIGSPLFPAYSAHVQKSEGEQKDHKDWLCNSSYTASNFKEIFTKQEELVKSEASLLKEKEKKHKKKSKHRKKKNLEKEHTPPLESDPVQESNSLRSYLNKKTFIEETGLSFERAYRVDQICDHENFYYDSLEQKKIAKYKLYPKIPFGCTIQEQSLWPQSSPSKFNQDISRYFSKKAVKLLKKSSHFENVFSSKTPASSIVTLDFIPLSPSAKLSESIKTQLETNFDGVSTSWKSVSSKTPEVEAVEMKDEPLDLDLRNKTITFNKTLAELPHDIQMWLDFVDFQEELYKSKDTGGFTESYLIEKKVAIIDKALKYNPKSVRLNIAKLNLCRSIWKIEKVIESWDNLIFLNPNDPQVWQEYVTFVLTDLTYFSVPRVLKVFSKCIRTLSNLSEGIIQSHEAPPDIVYYMLDIFSRLCFILKSCGYTEKAVAAFQALVEFNLFNDPSTESLSVSERIACFEPFWDSGAARFGEEAAIGWAATVLENRISFNKIVSQSDLSNIEDDILYKKFPEWKTWLEFERMREMHHWLPWKPNPEYDQTNDDIDDIDRTILFDDISKFLFCIHEEEHKFLLVLYFINFLGFDPHLFGCNISSSTFTNTHITIDNFDVISKKLHGTLFSMQDSNPLFFKINIWTGDRIGFVKNILSQSVGKFSLRYEVVLSLLRLRFLQDIALNCENVTESVDDVKKIAKNMLKESENRNCLLLWCEYIKIEYSSGSKIKAKKTAETLLTSSSFAVANDTMSMKELWYFVRSCIDFCLGFQENCSSEIELFSCNEIIWILINVGCKEKYVPYAYELIQPTLILKAIAGFKYFLNQELNSVPNTVSKLCYCLDSYSHSFIDCAKCFAYLQYFTQGLDAAVKVFKDTVELLGDKLSESCKRYILEQICICEAELINFHTKNSAVSMKPLLSYLYDSIKQYPDSIKLLHILVKWRSASCVVSPTRKFFAKILKDHFKIQPITWVFAIASELIISNSIADQKCVNTDIQVPDTASSCLGIKWKIRALYERALNSSLCGYIPILWRSYVKFEILNDEVEKAKSIFHRAVQNCGWSKELLMDGIDYFPDDLKQTIDFMTEKQIHMRTPLEEISLLMEHGIQN